ncbi:hypothetical protein [Serratia quinivorans]|uniref:hypothetical protein n=1 Tax=Serratia quinivorans TaxID=137545 RepID=UPI003981ACBE
MSLLRNITLLLANYQHKVSREEQQLRRLNRQIRQVTDELQVLETERQGMKKFLREMLPQREILSRALLFALQRKQSVVRRRLANIALEEGQQQRRLVEYQQQQAQALVRRKQLFRQTDKYQELQQTEKRKLRAVIARQEESDTEEIITWRK